MNLIITERTIMINSILDVFNSQQSRIQFTMEIRGNRLNFSDINLIINDNITEFNWYHKLTFSKKYLNFLSHHPITQKRSGHIKSHKKRLD